MTGRAKHRTRIQKTGRLQVQPADGLFDLRARSRSSLGRLKR